VVLVHGRAACKSDPNVLLPAAMLHRAGLGVLLIDLRNHGDSGVDNGRFTGGSKEYRDLLGAFDWLVAQGHRPERIGLFGTSLGAASAMIAFGQEPRIAALWEDSGPGDIATMQREYAQEMGYPAWVGDAVVPVARALGEPSFGTKSPLEEIRLRLEGRPFAIVHGLDDAAVRPHHALDLALAAEAGGTAVTPWLVPSARHTEEMLVVTAEYEARLVGFFRDALTATRPAHD
jgi:dipeptidyl aminopeptidase/acylaminoacyl peptidase